MCRVPIKRLFFIIMITLTFSLLLQLLSYATSQKEQPYPEMLETTIEVGPSNKRALGSQVPAWVSAQSRLQIAPLPDDQLRTLSGLSDKEQFLRLLQPILIPRVSGTPGNTKVQKFLINTLRGFGYTVETDSFDDSPPAPHARRTFTNIIATLDPKAPRRLLLACHFDSKFDNRGLFIGATDSAVPCAMLLDLARVLRGRVDSRSTKQDITLQLIFFDGEEAFGDWSAVDSIYGSRHLASRLAQTRNSFAPGVSTMSQLNSMDVLVLLDLIGTIDTKFQSLFPATAPLYSRLTDNEDRLQSLGQIKQWGKDGVYFGRDAMPVGSFIDDDHKPFMERGVKILHLISVPFPSVWHQLSDNADNLHYQTIDDLNKILRVFVCEYLSCRF
ncbi:hypothetical protein RvY_08115-2 [Ramazzottius varieornatus]|uniref:Glutaminyl-peptide cyclotransferase n=1 Tax=Ramazzottius varieornatus TaxID=947166 RepID=A0A1D1V4M0_RAMVA|nr:hypothetical protein RvY_08115-2 [Ramazzottius varieornatus]